MVITGKFHTCRKCKTRFNEIWVPTRPIVKEAVGIVPFQRMSSDVILVDYEGHAPIAKGFKDIP
jgi:hypothetical protein